MQPFPHPSDAKIYQDCQQASEIFKFESVDDDGRWRVDNGPLVYYQLTLWAFGSGELTRAVRGSDYSPAIVLSEEKDKLV